MKQSPLIVASSVAVCVLAIAVLLLAWICEIHYRHMRDLQPEIVKAQYFQNLYNALAAESLEYSKHNPAIDPILQQWNLKPAKTVPPPASSKPTGK